MHKPVLTTLQQIESRILTLDGLRHALQVWRFQSKKIVFTNGCFDILHLGHIDYLSKAADEGDVLVIGVNTDQSVQRQKKGPGRPINSEIQRARVLAALRVTDAVVLFDEDTPYELIKLVQPDILVKGADYAPEKIVGYDIVTARGGRVMTMELLPGYSTTALEQKLRGK